MDTLVLGCSASSGLGVQPRPGQLPRVQPLHPQLLHLQRLQHTLPRVEPLRPRQSPRRKGAASTARLG